MSHAEYYHKDFLENSMPSRDEEIAKLLGLAKVSENDVFYDLGSNLGGPVIASVQEPFNAKYAVGIEIQVYLAERSLIRIRELGLQDKVNIIHGNIFDCDLSPATVVYVFQSEPANEKLRSKLERELKKTSRVVSKTSEFKRWKCSEKTEIEFPFKDEDGRPLKTTGYLYRMDSI